MLVALNLKGVLFFHSLWQLKLKNHFEENVSCTLKSYFEVDLHEGHKQSTTYFFEQNLKGRSKNHGHQFAHTLGKHIFFFQMTSFLM